MTGSPSQGARSPDKKTNGEKTVKEKHKKTCVNDTTMFAQLLLGEGGRANSSKRVKKGRNTGEQERTAAEHHQCAPHHCGNRVTPFCTIRQRMSMPEGVLLIVIVVNGRNNGRRAVCLQVRRHGMGRLRQSRQRSGDGRSSTHIEQQDSPTSDKSNRQLGHTKQTHADITDSHQHGLSKSRITRNTSQYPHLRAWLAISYTAESTRREPILTIVAAIFASDNGPITPPLYPRFSTVHCTIGTSGVTCCCFLQRPPSSVTEAHQA